MVNEVQLYNLIKESFLLLDFGDRLFLKPYDLSIPRYYALSHIAAVPGLSPSLLSRYMFCDKSNITRIIHGLENDGLVERRPHECDGRGRRLYLTPAGASLHLDAAQAHYRYVEQRLSAVESYRAEEIINTLTQLNKSLNIELDNAPALLLN